MASCFLVNGWGLWSLLLSFGVVQEETDLDLARHRQPTGMSLAGAPLNLEDISLTIQTASIDLSARKVQG